MTEKQKQWTAWAILTAVTVAISLFFGVKYPVPPIPEDLPDQVVPLGVTHFTGLAIGDGTADVADGDDEIEADGAIDADSTLNVAGAVTFQGALYPSFTNLAVSNNTLITPTYTVYALDSTAAASCTLQATGTEGQLLILIGDDANNVTVNDTNLRSNDGSAQVLNAYDVLMLVYQDSEWIEISESNDS